MKNDKFPTVWVSNSSIGDFLKCQRAYYLKNIYRDPITNHKINLINPPLALGQAVHEVLESLSELKVDLRFKSSLEEKFESTWEKNYSGLLGGFESSDEEISFKNRGLKMIQNVTKNPGPLAKKALKLKDPDPKFSLPRFKLSEEEGIILCGKIDWLEYIPKSDGVNIIDFKTGANEEAPDSLQLPIYCLLVKNCQKRMVEGVSFWYLDRDDKPLSQKMPDLEKAKEKVLKLALEIKELRRAGVYTCNRGGCFACSPFEKIIKGDARLAKANDYQDTYALKN